MRMTIPGRSIYGKISSTVRISCILSLLNSSSMFFQAMGEPAEKVLKKFSPPKFFYCLTKNFIENRADIEVSRVTVMRILRQYGYKSYVRPLKPRLTTTHMKNQLRWVRERQHVSEDYWQSIIFTDECKFNLLGNDGPRRVYRLPGIPSLPCHIRPTVKFGGGSVMVWGAITREGVGNLVFIDTKMNSQVFIE
ncbi:hypothetical protein PAPHI01_2766, partial [Pancytospora philotis]